MNGIDGQGRDEKRKTPERPERRRFLLSALAGSLTGVAGVMPAGAAPQERSLREADFYTEHPWAG